MTMHSRVKAAQPQLGHGHALAIGTPVMTLEGRLPVEFLIPGDRVISRSGALKLRAIEMTLVQNARVVRIAASVIDVDRAANDLIVSPDQPILIRDWRAKALTGAAVALIPVSRLVDGEYIRAEIIADLRLFTLRFDEDVVIYAGNLELACTGTPVTA